MSANREADESTTATPPNATTSGGAVETPGKGPNDPATPSAPRFPVVGIGASAGGLKALTELLSHLQASGIAIIVVQHLSSEHESLLPELLARATSIPVLTATDLMPVVPNQIYVLPPNADIAMFHGALQVVPRASARGAHLPIDYLFRSLADDLGPLAIGVVLSGTGNDGTEGLRAIKAAGGFTFVQEPFTAQANGMPRSAIDAGCADLCLSAEGIGDELSRISQHPYLRPVSRATTTPRTLLQKLFVQIRAAFGNDLTFYKSSTIERRIERRMALLKIEGLEEYVERVASDPNELAALYKDVLISVTSFFRDTEPFEALKSLVFPRMMEQKHPGEAIRIWSAGCATGEETYSIAISLLEFLGDRAAEYEIQIFGTDVDADAVNFARRAVYPESIALDVSPERLERFFTRTEQHYQVAQRVRERVVFAVHNLTRDAPFSRLDLVVCRNVMIYLQPVLQKAVLRVFHYSLRADGMLLLGNSESASEAVDLFALADRKNKLFVPKRATSGAAFNLGVQTTLPARQSTDRRAKAASRHTPTIQQLADRTVLERFGPPGVVIDENLAIVQFRGRTGEFLEPAPGSPTNNLLGLARPELRGELRAAIRRAMDEHAPVRVIAPRFVVPPGSEPLRIDVLPIANHDGHASGLLVLFSVVASADETAVDQPREVESRGDHENSELRRELHATRMDLENTIAELETANEELKVTNEELQSTNEELQSANEELETSREELQSGNEEILTVNDELRARLAELGRQRDDLANLLTVMSAAIAVIGTDMRVRRISRAAERLLQLPPSASERTVAQIKPFFGEFDLERAITAVLGQADPIEQDVLGADKRWYRMRLMPYVTADREVRGALVEWSDIDVRKRAAELGRVVSTYADQVLSAVLHPLLILDERLRVVWTNRAFLEAFHVSQDEILGIPLRNVGAGEWGDPALRAALERILADGTTFKDMVFPVGSTAATTRSLRMSGSPVLGLAGSQRLVLLSIEDTPPTAARSG